MVNGKVKFNGTFKTPVKGYHVDCNLGFCYSNSTNEPTIENGETIFVENGNDPITDGMVYSADMSDIEYNTTYYYRFFFQNPHSGEYVYGDTQSFKLEMDKWVDLGLPSGILWAAWNVGANSPEEYGGYYAWGETEEKSNYLDYYEYEFYDSWYGSFDYLGSVISGTKYDVAHVKWGDGARMPTYYDFDELIANCTKEVDTYNGVNGVYLTGPNGNSIFIPFSGDRAVNFTKEGESGVLWTGTYGKDSTGKRLNACCVFCRGASIYLRNDIKRTYGMTVRPVKSK
jgi:hypothetical protein